VRKYCFLILLLSILLDIHAQFHTAMSRSEMGFLAGGMYYIGDLNSFGHFKGVQPSVGFLYRYNIHSRLTFRANLLYGNLEGDDAWAKDLALSNRNLNFRTQLFELASGVEFHYMPFQIGSKKYKGTAYLLAQLAGFHINPKTFYNDEWIFLQPLGTEGQGSEIEGYSTKKRYSLYQFAIPIGVGLKFSIGKKAVIGIEYTVRKTFTDYIDDVGSDSYLPAEIITDSNGPLSARLANKSLNGDMNGMRGNSKTKDWYMSALITCTLRLGNPEKCAFME